MQSIHSLLSFLIKLAGVDDEVLNRHEGARSDRVKLTMLGITLLCTGIFLSIIYWRTLTTLIANPWLAVPLALTIALLIITFDCAIVAGAWDARGDQEARLIASIDASGDGRQKERRVRFCWTTFFRISAVLCSSYVTASMFELIIFEEAIKVEIQRANLADENNQKQFANMEQLQADLEARLHSERDTVARLQQALAPKEAQLNDLVQDMDDLTRELDRQRDLHRQELEGIGDKVQGCGKNCRYHADRVQALSATLADKEALRTRLAAEVQAQQATLARERAALKALEDSYPERLQAIETQTWSGNRLVLEGENDLLIRMAALWRIMDKPEYGYRFTLWAVFWKLFFISLELMPLLTKALLTRKSAYRSSLNHEHKLHAFELELRLKAEQQRLLEQYGFAPAARGAETPESEAAETDAPQPEEPQPFSQAA